MSIADLEMARLSELGVEVLLGALSEDEAIEYEQLRARTPQFDLYELERAAAALQLAAMEPADSLPERLRIRVATDAAELFRLWGARRREAPPRRPLARLPELRHPARWIAAAASVVAAALWFGRPTAPPPGTASTQPIDVARRAPEMPAMAPQPAVPAPLPAPLRATAPEDPAAARERLLASNRFVLQRSWRAGNDASGQRVSGDVVWDARSQRGFMRFAGLRRNNPAVEQYQLWIFDARRDERYPVDGGVFDITRADGEQVIPIHAALKVGVPLMFAVTVERPGGVVVSDRSRIAALANTG